MQAYFQPFLATPDDVRELRCRIQHQLTMLVPQRRRQGPSSLSGVTVWATSAKELKLMLDWTLLDSGAVVLTSPLEIRSNIVFMRDGRPMSVPDQRVWIGELVTLLPWQKWVKAHLSGLARGEVNVRTAAPGAGSGSRGRMPVERIVSSALG